MEDRGSIEERLDRLEKIAASQGSRFYGYEYKSSASILGLPLIHIAYGVDENGRFRVAKGILAIGQVAIGLFAIGGFSIGVFALGGFALALVAALGGFAAGGYVALGGFAIAGSLAIGGMAISWNYAIGGMAIGPHPLGGNYQDPEVVEFIKSIFKGWKF